MKLEFIAENDPGFKLSFELDRYGSEPEIDVMIDDSETEAFSSSDVFGLNVEDAKSLIRFLIRFVEEAEKNADL